MNFLDSYQRNVTAEGCCIPELEKYITNTVDLRIQKTCASPEYMDVESEVLCSERGKRISPTRPPAET